MPPQDIVPRTPPPWKIRLWHAVRSLRPIQLGAILKKIFRVGRFHYQLPAGEIFWIDPISNLGLFLLRENEYERPMTELLRVILREGDTFIDIGANEGYFMVIAARAVGASGKVHAIEPQSRLTEVLRENVRANDLEGRVTLHPIGLAEKDDEEEELFLAPDINTGASSFRRYWKLGFARERIRVQSLPSLFAINRIAHARLAKIDCEGAENRLLAGAASLLQAQCIDYLIVEYHPWIAGIEACRRAHELMLRVGYRLLRINHQFVYYRAELHAEAQLLKKLRTNPAQTDEEVGDVFCEL